MTQTTNPITFTVFSKPWKMELLDLVAHIETLRFDGIELPVRPGYPVTPENVTQALPQAAHVFAERGMKIASIAGPTDARTVAACETAGIPLIRICVGMRHDERYLEGEARLQREFDQLLPLLERHGVTLGIQNHYGNRDVCNAMGLRHLIERYDPKRIAAVWDAGHNGLEGEAPESAIDIVWSHLCMVNLKSAFWKRKNSSKENSSKENSSEENSSEENSSEENSSESEEQEWEAYWTTARQGRANWLRVAQELQRRGYQGVVCLTAEYTDETAVNRLITKDLAYVRSLFASEANLS